MNRTAILIDGGFFVKRAIRLWGKRTPEELAIILQDYCNRHLKRNRDDFHQLYRIFYYDCPPINKKMHHPLSNRLIDFSKTDQYEWRLSFHTQLRKLRKMALRLGHLDEEGTNWNLDPRLLRSILNGKLPISKLREEDILLNTKQKGVDMRIGVDIASMSYKGQVQQMILIAGDSDFVPAAKLARREGIDFILDPMWAQIKPDLFEHIDGLRTVCESPHASGEDPFEDAGSKAEMGFDLEEWREASPDEPVVESSITPTIQQPKRRQRPVQAAKPAPVPPAMPAPVQAASPVAPVAPVAPAPATGDRSPKPRTPRRRNNQPNKPADSAAASPEAVKPANTPTADAQPRTAPPRRRRPSGSRKKRPDGNAPSGPASNPEN